MTTLHFDHALLPEGWAHDVRIEVADGCISEFRTAAVRDPGDEHHSIVLPGLDNAHSHVFQRAMAGRTEMRTSNNDSFWTWREQLYATALRITPQELEVIAAFAYAEMLESGFTRVGEFHYLHHAPDGRSYQAPAELSERIASAALDSGIRLTLLPVFYAHGGFGAAAPREEQRRFISNMPSFERLMEAARKTIASLPGSRLGIAPHSLRAVTPEQLQQLVSRFADLPVHIHVAEQLREVEECRAALGAAPVEWLLQHHAVNKRWTFVHATHVSDKGVRALAQSGAVACICPITEANLGDGIFEGRLFSDAGGSVAIGSDSNVVIDAAGELRQLEYSQRLRHHGRNVLGAGDAASGRALLTRVWQGGRRSLAATEHGLQTGAPADFFSLPSDVVEESAGDPDVALNLWIFGSRQPRADTVWTNGCKRVVDGRHVQRETLRRRFLDSMTALLSR